MSNTTLNCVVVKVFLFTLHNVMTNNTFEYNKCLIIEKWLQLWQAVVYTSDKFCLCLYPSRVTKPLE